MGSVWSETCEIAHRQPLKGDTKTQVAVIGAGLAGILTAWRLQQRGVQVVVLEADRIGSGATKNTTAKITSQHGLFYSSLLTSQGQEKAQQYASANQQAIQEYARIVREKQIDCDFEWKPAYLYTLNNSGIVEREAIAAQQLGIAADYTCQPALPFPVKGTVRFPKQAQFHPLKFLKALADDLTVYEKTMVHGVEDGVVQTEHGNVQADCVVVTTHFPFINTPGYYFMRMHQSRSYVIALKNAAQLDGMYLDEAEGGYFFRNYQDLLLLSGLGHRTGENHTGGYYDRLIEASHKFYPESQVCYQWSAQDCETVDGIPYIGKYASGNDRLFVATGFKKWGMTNAMVSAMLLTDMLMGKQPDYAEVFSPQRFVINQALLTDAGKSVKALAKQYLTLPEKLLAGLPEGHGGIVKHEGQKVGVYKTETGTCYLVDPRCPHLGCQLEWNPDEKSWDCPCHGSRFSYQGDLIDNPAMQGLEATRKKMETID